jgi:hypothetical protein
MVTITIHTDNDAFGDPSDYWQRHEEIARILETLAKAYRNNVIPTTLRDYNGNSVGTVDDDN